MRAGNPAAIWPRRSATQAKRPQPGIDLSERILLPLFGRPVAQDIGILDKPSHTGRPEALYRIELARDAIEADRATRVTAAVVRSS